MKQNCVCIVYCHTYIAINHNRNKTCISLYIKCVSAYNQLVMCSRADGGCKSTTQHIEGDDIGPTSQPVLNTLRWRQTRTSSWSVIHVTQLEISYIKQCNLYGSSFILTVCHDSRQCKTKIYIVKIYTNLDMAIRKKNLVAHVVKMWMRISSVFSALVVDTCVVCSNKHQWIRHMGIIRWWYQLLLSALCLQWNQLQLCSCNGQNIGEIPCWNHRRRCHIRTSTNADLRDNSTFSTWISSCWCYQLCSTKDPATVPTLDAEIDMW